MAASVSGLPVISLPSRRTFPLSMPAMPKTALRWCFFRPLFPRMQTTDDLLTARETPWSTLTGP